MTPERLEQVVSVLEGRSNEEALSHLLNARKNNLPVRLWPQNHTLKLGPQDVTAQEITTAMATMKLDSERRLRRA